MDVKINQAVDIKQLAQVLGGKGNVVNIFFTNQALEAGANPKTVWEMLLAIPEPRLDNWIKAAVLACEDRKMSGNGIAGFLGVNARTIRSWKEGWKQQQQLPPAPSGGTDG